jgi:hypothetical protein
MTGRSPLWRRRSALDCRAIYEEEEEEEEEDHKQHKLSIPYFNIVLILLLST